MQPRKVKPTQRTRPASARNDAIHRAILSGLLGNIGHKTDPHEYTGARGTKFAIFPGSALFKAEPQWVMAAEIVETSRLYARTVAAIQPEWAEQLAEHLVKRTWSDPHWNPQTAHVVAYEKVTLYGLPLIARRPVHYGPIDPRLSREIFIKALVDGDYQPDAPFYRHNLRLIEEIERLEAKSRQRNLLVDAQVRFDFYDARIPAGIHNGPAFEKWRAQAERHDPRILFMSRRDLMLHAAGDITQEMFPDAIVVGSINVPLEYHLEPGHPADGVTAVIPIAALSQVPASRFEWLVPGLLREKITALIKSLPKALRVHFVPAPDVAEGAFAALKPGDGSLLEALAIYLSRLKGITVAPSAFDPGSLLDHLHMNFRIVDDAGKVLASGRDLAALRRQLGLKIQSQFEQVRHPLYNRDNITRWDFGDLPESICIQRHGMTLTAYPALVDLAAAAAADARPIGARAADAPKTATANGVGLRLFDSPESARAAHAAGLRRLLMLELRDEIACLNTRIAGLQEMYLHYATLGSPQELRDDIIGKTIQRAFLHDTNVRTAMEYELRKEAGRRHRLLEIAQEVADMAARILAAYHNVALALARPVIAAWQPAIADVREQLAHLLPRGFLTNTPDQWLAHFPRYLKAIELRLGKLITTGHSKDAAKMAELQPFWRSYLQRQAAASSEGVIDPELTQFRWMIEEFRVSLFAQELKTSIPISAKRLERQWQIVQRRG